jgi:hypothetical protein
LLKTLFEFGEFPPRQHSINVYLKEKMGDEFDEDDVVPIKQVWKWIFPHRMQEAMAKKYVTGETCQFFMELQVKFDKDEEELACL